MSIKRLSIYVLIFFIIAFLSGCLNQNKHVHNTQNNNKAESIVNDQLQENTIPADTLNVVNNTNKPFTLPLFSQDSVWNQPIKEGAKIDDSSEVMIEQLQKDQKHGVVLSVHEWSSTVFFADESTPKIDVKLSRSWWNKYNKIKKIPIPINAIPDPKNDGHMCIIDLDERLVYEFWRMNKQDENTWVASWGNRISLDSNGIYPCGMSARGSGFSLIAGMIWPEELQQGKIEHALILSIPSVKKGGPVYPATESDGYKGIAGAIPEGARLQLNPDINLDDYNLSNYERIICECLQKYGAYVGDVSGSVELEAISPLSYEKDPYNSQFNEQWIILDNIPLREMKVLELPAQIQNPELKVMDESIYE